ncbi:helix-turn-helix domain-containing protein [Novosphingobium soli]|uniref:Helix-turn-helix domain-containing protein n=1 Tax=Novosphingobium soli TaxID=574956 RepID=A0ABV6CY76_9SPHN
MGLHTLGEALNGALAGALAYPPAPRRKAKSGAPHPTGARVLRDSVEAGTFEEVFFVPPAKGETDRMLRAARRGLDAGRQLRREARQGLRELTAAERVLTTLTAASVRVFEEILTLARLNRGRVFPSYDHLAQATSLGRATVARALGILEAIGFLVRQRRFKRIEAQGPGPRYEQTSNAYRPMLPKGLQAYLPRWMRPAPLPDDEIQRRVDQDEDMEHMRAQLSCREWAQATADGPLGKVLAKLGAALDRALEHQERESQIHPQPLHDSHKKNSMMSWPSRPTPTA